MQDNQSEIKNNEKIQPEIKTGHSRARFFSIVLLVLASFLVGYITGDSSQTQKITNSAVAGKYGDVPRGVADSVDFDLFWDVWDIIQKDHIDRPISETKLFYGAMKGLVDAVGDPYTEFFSPEKAAEFNEQLSGSFEGIGAEIGIRDEQLVIIAPLPDTPAEQAGLRAGDEILYIDGKDTFGLSVEDAVLKIRGTKGTTVVLGIKHSDGSVVDIPVTRDTIQVASVVHEIIVPESSPDSKIAYIRISHFNEDTPSSFRSAVQDSVNSQVDGVVLDLRNNPGGYLDTAVDVASYWIEDGPVVVEKRPSSESVNHDAVGSALLQGTPTVVLVNEGSASASEIVAGALQDYGQAQILGERTFGKGSVQELQMLPDGSAIKVTVTSWFTPNGRSINKDGISPDVEIIFDLEKAQDGVDNVLDEAIQIILK